MNAVGPLLRDLRVRGVRLSADGTRLRVQAPAQVISEDERRSLADVKPLVLATLAREAKLLTLTVSEFGRQDLGVEVAVPWLEETVWLVPRVDQADRLVRSGVKRGRIWTATELADLFSIDGVSPDDIARIGRLKAMFGAEVCEVGRDVPEASRG